MTNGRGDHSLAAARRRALLPAIVALVLLVAAGAQVQIIPQFPTLPPLELPPKITISASVDLLAHDFVEESTSFPETVQAAGSTIVCCTYESGVEVGWIAGAGTGEAYVCVETTCQFLTNLDTATKKVHSVRWGTMDVGANADLGSLDVDQVESRRATPGASL